MINYEGIYVHNVGGEFKMKKSIVEEWKNRKKVEIAAYITKQRSILRREDKIYKDIAAAIDKWKDDIDTLTYEDIISYARYCIGEDTKNKIAAIEKEYKDRFNAIEKKAEMVTAALEYVNDYDSMKKVLEDFGIWKEIIEE